MYAELGFLDGFQPVQSSITVTVDVYPFQTVATITGNSVAISLMDMSPQRARDGTTTLNLACLCELFIESSNFYVFLCLPHWCSLGCSDSIAIESYQWLELDHSADSVLLFSTSLLANTNETAYGSLLFSASLANRRANIFIYRVGE